MQLYIINCEITFDQVQHLLNHLTLYNGEVCDIVEVNNLDIQNIKQGYLSKLTMGKLQQQANKNIKYNLNDLDNLTYYLVQTLQIKVKDIIHDICYNNAYRSLKVYLDQGINANIQNNRGGTPLHAACEYNRVEIVKLLLDNGAKKNIQDNFGWTPLHYACLDNSVESVKLLLLNGANINIQDNQGFTPLQLAVKHNAKDCIKLLQP